MKTFLSSLVVFLVLIFSSSIAIADCPGGKTAFIWVNGILTQQADWDLFVLDERTKFLTTHPILDSDCIKFVSVYNNTQGAVLDFIQSAGQWELQGIDAITFLQGFRYVIDPFIDADFFKLKHAVDEQLDQGYRVVLVGHSQGTYFTTAVYDALTTNPPDSRKLSVVNIASAASYVKKGVQKHITQCGDPIIFVPDSLPVNVNQIPNIDFPGTFTCGTLGEVSLHFIDSSYLADGTVTQQQIYSDLEASLPDPGCGTDTNCYLKDPFNGSLNNFEKVNYGIAEGGDPIVTASGGVLQMISRPAASAFPTGHLTLNTKRNFVGDFTANLEYNSYGEGVNDIVLVNAKDNTVAAHWALIGRAANTDWGSLTFTKTNSQINMYVDGVFEDSVSTTSTSGYYLKFDLKGNITLKIRNLLVMSGATPPPPPPPPPGFTLTPPSTNLYIMQGSSGTANITLASQGGLSGNATIALYCSSTSCPSGFSYNFTGGIFPLPANGSIPIHATFFPSNSAIPGVYNYEYRVTVGNTTKISTMSVTVTSPTPTTGTIIIIVNPDTNTTHSATNCSINNTGGFSVTYGPTILNGQTPGSKSIVCTFYPGVWMFDSIMPSATQNLSAGGTITFTVNLKLSPVPPTPVLSSIQINSEPTVNRAINVSLFGTNVFGGSQGYVCTSTATSSCVETNTSFFTSSQVRFTNVRSSFPTTLYLRVSNTSGVFSNYMSMVVIP